jgi:hypothetical protein
LVWEVGRARDAVGLRKHARVGVGARRRPDRDTDRLRLLDRQRLVQEQPSVAVAGRGLDRERGVDLNLAALALVGVRVDRKGNHGARVFDLAALLGAFRDRAGLDVDVVARSGIAEGRFDHPIDGADREAGRYRCSARGGDAYELEEAGLVRSV